MSEIWKSVIGYEDSYEVSSYGNVRSLDRYIEKRDGTRQFYKGKLLTPQKVGVGYYQIKLGNHSRYMQQLVAESFLDFRADSGMEVHHIDYDKSNNAVDNLQIVSRADNVNDAFKHYGKQYEPRLCVVCGVELSSSAKGNYCVHHREYEHKKSLPDIQEVVLKLRSGSSFLSLGKEYGVSDNAVRKWLKAEGLPYKASDYKREEDKYNARI